MYKREIAYACKYYFHMNDAMSSHFVLCNIAFSPLFKIACCYEKAKVDVWQLNIFVDQLYVTLSRTFQLENHK
jgi:hypothetical protein